MQPDTRVSIAFDLTAQGQGDFFTLNDAVRGELDNTTYVLAGDVLVDVTSDVRSVRLRRGRSWQLDRVQAGDSTVVLSNNTRDYDPTNALATGTRRNVVPNPSFEVDLVNWSSASSYFTQGQTQRFNLMPNPSFEVSLSGWGSGATDLTTAGATVSRSSVESYVGSHAAYVECSASATTEGISYVLSNLKPSTTYRISAYAYGDIGSSAVLSTKDLSASVTGTVSASAATGSWTRLDSTITTGATSLFTLDTSELDDAAVFLAEGNETALLIAATGFETGASFFTLDDPVLGELDAIALAPEPGAKFYLDAILVEETSSLLPYFDGSDADASLNDAALAWDGTSGLSTSTLTWVIPTISQSSAQNLYGAAAALVEMETRFANQGIHTTLTGLAANTTYTISGWVYVQQGSSVRMGTRDVTNGVSGTLSSTTSAAAWTRVSSTITTGASTADVLIAVFTTSEYIVPGSGPFSVFYLDGVLAETGSDLLPYFDGTVADGSIIGALTAWEGTPNDSPSGLTFRVPGTGSPYWPSIKPRKEVQITVEGTPVFTGSIEDWDFTYSPNSDSTATLKAADGFAILAQTQIDPVSVPSELSGARVERILDRAEVAWPSGRRAIDTGQQTLAAQDIGGTSNPQPVNSLTYLQKIDEAEYGAMYIDGAGLLRFRDRSSAQVFSGVTFNDVGSGIPFTNISIDYGVESLRNRIVINRIGGSILTAEDFGSVQEYGVIQYEIRDTLLEDDQDAEDLALLILGRYAQPSLRIDRIGIDLKAVTSAQVQQIISLDLGDVVEVRFTPNGIGNPINQFLSVDAIEHTITPRDHRVTFDLSETSLGFVLDDPVFGILDVSRLAY